MVFASVWDTPWNEWLQTKLDHLYILVVSDYFTRWPEAYVTTVASKLIIEWVSCFGVMQHLDTHKRQDFKSNIFQNLTDMFGVEKRCTRPYLSPGKQWRG